MFVYIYTMNNEQHINTMNNVTNHTAQIGPKFYAIEVAYNVTIDGETKSFENVRLSDSQGRSAWAGGFAKDMARKWKTQMPKRFNDFELVSLRFVRTA